MRTYYYLDNLISLSDRTEKERKDIARKGGIASGKRRLKDAYTKKQLQNCLFVINAQKEINNIVKGYKGRHKNNIDINNLETLAAYLPIKTINKLIAISNRIDREKAKAERIRQKYQSKYNEKINAY